MTDLRPITPLKGDVARVDAIGTLTITETPYRALASLAARKGREADVAVAMKSTWDLTLPGPNALASGAHVRAWWVGPAAWMLDAGYVQHELLADEVKGIVGDSASVTEQTDGWCRFDVTGTGMVAMFERLCAVDMETMESGAATRTSIHHLGCFVIRTNNSIQVIGPRSSAGSLHHAMTTAAQAVA